jgi:muconolactone delta-isomerase
MAWRRGASYSQQGFVTIMAAALPMLVDSKADEARRAEEKAESRRDQKKAAVARMRIREGTPRQFFTDRVRTCAR